jgi:hypothetical protein
MTTSPWSESLTDTLTKLDMIPMVTDYMEMLASKIGESPEAWRGVEIATDQLIAFMAGGQEQGVGEPQLITVMFGVLVAVSTHPLTTGWKERS